MPAATASDYSHHQNHNHNHTASHFGGAVALQQRASTKVLLQPKPNEEPIYVNWKQAKRMLKMREKRESQYKRMLIVKGGAQQQAAAHHNSSSSSHPNLRKFDRVKCKSRQEHAKSRKRV